MITFDPQELEEIIKAISSSSNTDAMPAYSWARSAKVLLAEVERLHSELEKLESQNDSLREMISVSAAEVGQLMAALIEIRDKRHSKSFTIEQAGEVARRALEGKEVK